MKDSGGDPRAYSGFVRVWDQTDTGFSNTPVATGAGTLGQPVSVQPFGSFTLYVNATGVVTVTVQSGDIDNLVLWGEFQVGAPTSGAGRFAFPFGGSAPNLPGLLFTSLRFRLTAGAGGPFNATTILVGRV